MRSIEKVEVYFENHNYSAILETENIFELNASFCKEEVGLSMEETIWTKYLDKFEIIISKNAKTSDDKYLFDVLKEDKIEQATLFYEEGGADNCLFDHIKDKDGESCQKIYIDDNVIRAVASKNKEDLKEQKIMLLDVEVKV